MATTFLHFNKVKVRSIHNFILLCLISLSRILITKYFKAKKKTIEERDSSLAQEQLRQEEELRNAESLYSEASSRLQNAIKERDMNEMSVVQGLMDVASKKMESARRKLEDCRKNQITIGSKRKREVEKYSSTLTKLVNNTK